MSIVIPSVISGDLFVTVPAGDYFIALTRLGFWLLFYARATSKVIPGQVRTCDSAHLRWRYSAAPLGTQVTSITPWYPHSVTLSCDWANHSLSYSNSAECLVRKLQLSILKSLVWLDQVSDMRGSDSPIFLNRRRMLYYCARYQDNASEWEISLWCSWPGLPVQDGYQRVKLVTACVLEIYENQTLYPQILGILSFKGSSRVQRQ